jgi:hypothetical protein
VQADVLDLVVERTDQLISPTEQRKLFLSADKKVDQAEPDEGKNPVF